MLIEKFLTYGQKTKRPKLLFGSSQNKLKKNKLNYLTFETFTDNLILGFAENVNEKTCRHKTRQIMKFLQTFFF